MDHSSISDSFPIQHHHFSFTLRTVSSSESYFYILFFWCYFDFFSLHEHSFYLTAVDVRDKNLSEAFKCFSFYLWSDICGPICTTRKDLVVQITWNKCVQETILHSVDGVILVTVSNLQWAITGMWLHVLALWGYCSSITANISK